MNDSNRKAHPPQTVLLNRSSFIKEYRESTAKKILLDCRNPDETALGILPNAYVIPLPDLVHRIKEIPSDAEVFIYCRSGNRAKTAASALAERGIQSIKIAADCGYSELKNDFSN